MALVTITRGLTGVYTLLIDPPSGIAKLGGTRQDAINSFMAVGFGVFFWLLLQVHSSAMIEHNGLVKFGLVEAASFTIRWCLMPVFLITACKVIDRPERTMLAIAGYNWGQALILACIFIPLAVMGLFGGPQFPPFGLGMILVMLNLAFNAILLHRLLGSDWLVVIMLVGVDFVLSLIIVTWQLNVLAA